jgi:hypothetical protein
MSWVMPMSWVSLRIYTNDGWVMLNDLSDVELKKVKGQAEAMIDKIELMLNPVFGVEVK